MYNKETEALIQTLERFKDVEGIAKASHRRMLQQLEQYVSLIKLEVELIKQRDKYQSYCSEVITTDAEDIGWFKAGMDDVKINAEKIKIKTF